MIKRSLSLALFCALSSPPQLAFAATHPDEQGKALPVESGPSIYSLSEAELQYHKGRALLGDPTSGYCLAMHFSFSASENSETEYWITVAAENGNSDAMQMLSIQLSNKRNPRDSSRAKYWKERAAKTAAPPPPQAQCHRISD